MDFFSDPLSKNPHLIVPIKILANRFRDGIESNFESYNQINEPFREILKYVADFIGYNDNEKRVQWILLGAYLAYNKLRKHLKKDRNSNQPVKAYEIDSLRNRSNWRVYIWS